MPEDVIIPLKLGGDELLNTFIEMRKQIVALRDTYVKSQDDIQKSAAASAEKQNVVNGTIRETNKVLATLGQGGSIKNITEGVAGSIKVFDRYGNQVKATAKDIDAALKMTGKSTAGITEGQKQYNAALDLAKQKVVDLLGKVGTLSAEEQQLVRDMLAYVDAERQAAEQGQKLAEGPQRAAVETEKLASSMQDAEASIALAVAQYGKFSPETEQAVRNANRLRSSFLDIKVKAAAFTEEEKKAVAQGQRLFQTVDAIEKEMRQLPEPANQTGAAVTSLRRQFMDAKLAIEEAVVTFGEFSPEVQQAELNAAKLRDRIRDLDQRLEALNPDAKFAAFSQFASSIAGGFTAAQGAMALFGAESEDVQKSLLKVQGALAVTQGLQALFGGLKDSVANIRRVLTGLVTSLSAAKIAESNLAAAQLVTTRATAGQATATTVLSGAFKSAQAGAVRLWAVIAANPIIAGTVAITGLIAAIVLFSRETKAAVLTLEDFYKQLDRQRERSKFVADDIAQKELLENERQAIAAREEALKIKDEAARESALKEVERQKEIADGLTEQAKIERDITAAKKEQAAVDERIKQTEDEIAKNRSANFRGANLLNASDNKKRAEEIQQSKDRSEALRLEIAKLEAELANKQVGSINKVKGADVTALEDRLNKAREVYSKLEKEAKDAADELVRTSEDLAKRVSAAELETADPFERLELQRRAAELEVQNLEDKLKKLNELTKASDETIAEQDRQLAILRLQIQEDHYNNLFELQRKATIDRVGLIEDDNKRELLLFEAGLREQVKARKEEGFSDDEINEFKRQQRAEFARKQTEEEIAAVQAIGKNKIEARQRTFETEEAFERQKQLDLLAIDLVAVEARLELIKNSAKESDVVLRSELQKDQAIINAAIAKLKGTPEKVDLFSLLGITVSDAQREKFQQDVELIKSSLSSIVGSYITAQFAMLDAQAATNEQLQSGLEDRIANTEQALEDELQRQKDGYASNVQAKQDELNSLKLQRDAALKDEQKIAKEREKIQKQQVVLDSIAQGSALATATANLFRKEALSGVPGIIAAGAAALGMLAFFINLRARFKAITSQQFGEGGWVGGKSHAEGGTHIEAERDEFVVKKASAKKHKVLVEAINKDDFTKVRQQDIADLISGLGIELDRGAVQQMVDRKQQFVSSTTVNNSIHTERLERQVGALTDEVKGLRRDSARSEKVTQLPDGTRIVDTPGQRIVIRQRK